MITEDQLEQLSIEWFNSIGYDYICGYDIAPGEPAAERTDYNQIVLLDRLVSQLRVINPNIPLVTLEQVAVQISKPETPILIKNNKAFHQQLLKGVKVEFKDDKGKEKTDHVQLIDFANESNNQFLVVNQFTITGTKGNRRPDLIVFINGLPIAVIELKNPADYSADIWKSFQQIQTYKEEIPDLFIFNEALVVSDGLNARVGSLTASKERFMPWRVVNHEDDKPHFEYHLETLVKGFFKPYLFLDYLKHFILFENDGGSTDEPGSGTIIKKIAGYHQFHAVREAVKATVIAAQPSKQGVEERRASYGEKVQPGSGKAGVVW
ncbi:MAG: type I restriction endonuclease, partial [Flavobacteriaceae bacterium]|nr:type I restriction endonuclease [Flavobacteriaceae bacterium]